MTPPAGDTNVIRRSIYQNSNTLVELLIKSKEPRPRTATGGSTGGRSTAASEPAWPAAVPLRRDGRPLSATSQQLPLRPRTGRPLPAWQPTGGSEGCGRSPERGRAGRPPPGRGGLTGGAGGRQRPAQGRPQTARGQPPRGPQGPGVAPGRPAPPGAARKPEGDEVDHGASAEFKLWTQELSKLVQDIRKRPATAHLRPLLSRLEETVRVPPAPPTALQSADDGHDPLRARLEEIQLENEELQRKFQTLNAAMREYQQQQLAANGEAGGRGAATSAESRVRRMEEETELAEVKRQLAKYKRYAKELKKTKENLLNTIQAMEENHATELKSLKEEHETQVAQVLAQFTNETEMLVSFRADAEAVQRSLAQRVRENSELQRTLSERDTEIERLAALNQTLHELALKQLQQLASSDLPSLSQLMTKLQSPSAGGGGGGGGDCAGPVGGTAQDGSGDGAGRSAWLAAAVRDASLLSLDVTEPLPPRPFPGDWADLSLTSVVGSAVAAADGTEQREPADGDRDRRPPSGSAGDPPPSAATNSGGGGGSRRQVTGSGVDTGRPRQEHLREFSNGDTNRRLFGGDGDRVSGSPSDRRPAAGEPSDQPRVGGGRSDPPPVRSDDNCDRRANSGGCGDHVPISGGRAGPQAFPDSGVTDQCGVTGGGGGGGGSSGAGDCRRPPPVGSQASEEEGFQRSLARLNERLSDLQQGIHRAAQVLTP